MNKGGNEESRTLRDRRKTLKAVTLEGSHQMIKSDTNVTPKRGRGRPRKNTLTPSLSESLFSRHKRKKRVHREVNSADMIYAQDKVDEFRSEITFMQADTERFKPTKEDVEMFNEVLSKTIEISLDGFMTPNRKSANPISTPSTVLSQQLGTNSKIQKIIFGNYEITPWYSAPYPAEYLQGDGSLYICGKCFKYTNQQFGATRHSQKCIFKHPPGTEIYRDTESKVSIFEIDGKKSILYCQNLCLFAKMFLDHKTLYYDVEPFLFYVLTEWDHALGTHRFVGYFSKVKEALIKEKYSESDYNVSCILTMPVFQRKGYGNFLIDFSYLLTQAEGRTGSPEKPLSQLGLLSYKKYWTHKVVEELSQLDGDSISIQELSRRTSMTIDDVILALEWTKILTKSEDGYELHVDRDLIKKHLEEHYRIRRLQAHSKYLKWTPFVE